MVSQVELKGEEPGPGSQSSLRQANEGRIVDALRLGGPTTQAELARRTALAPSTVSGIVRDLAEAGVVHVEGEHGGRRGRRVELLLGGRLLVGVDVGHAHVSVGLATPAGDLEATRYAPLGDGHTHTAVLATVRDLVAEMVAERGLQPSALLAAGMSVPAPLDLYGRILGSRAVLPGWAGVDLAAAAGEALGLPVSVDNDANAGVLAERRWGAASGASHVLYVKLGHGVGAGLILNGEVYRGATGVSGELGHTIVDEFGAFCRCGNRGCLETRVNARHLVGQLRGTNPAITSVEALVTAARAGDPAAARLLEDTGRLVGLTLANACNLLNPEVVVVGGSLADAGEALLEPLRREVARHGVPSATRDLRIVPAALRPRTHLMGALGLAMDAAELPTLRR